MTPTPDELRKLRQALRKAFPAGGRRFELVVADADIGLDFAECEGPYESKIHAILQHAVGQFRLISLLEAAVKAAPDNPELSQISELLAQYHNIVPRLLPSDNANDKSALGDAERVLFKNVEFENVRDWLRTLDQFTRVVCRIEPQPRKQGINGYGTGFLVGPNVVLTCDHVADHFWSDTNAAARARVRFDCVYTTEGKAAEGVEYRLATDYQVLRDTGLDYALLKLDVANAHAGGQVSVGDRRGFVTPVAHRFEDTEPLLIVQHPMAEPMKLALGSLTNADQWPAGHITYSANTDGGSSGAPCLTQQLRVGALHHVGAGAHNQGVLMSAIIAHWSAPPNRERLVAHGLAHLLKSDAAYTVIESVSSGAVIGPRVASLLPNAGALGGAALFLGLASALYVAWPQRGRPGVSVDARLAAPILLPALTPAAIEDMASYGAAGVPALLTALDALHAQDKPERQLVGAVAAALKKIGAPSVEPLEASFEKRINAIEPGEIEPHAIRATSALASILFDMRDVDPSLEGRLNRRLVAHLNRTRTLTADRDLVGPLTSKAFELLYRSNYRLKSSPVLRNLYFGDHEFNGLVMKDLDFSRVTFAGVVFVRCDFTGAVLEDANLEAAAFGTATSSLDDLRATLQGLAASASHTTVLDREVQAIVQSFRTRPGSPEMERLLEHYKTTLR